MNIEQLLTPINLIKIFNLSDENKNPIEYTSQLIDFIENFRILPARLWIDRL